MTEQLAKTAGKALIWQAVQLVGVKSTLLLRLLILARLLSPEDFGLLAIALIGVDLMLKLTDFGMLPALVQRAVVGAEHYNSAWTIGVVRALAVTVMVLLFAPVIAAIFDNPNAVLIIRVVAFRPLIEALASIRVAELTRALKFDRLAFLRLSEVFANAIVSIALARVFGVWGLIIGLLMGAAVYTTLSYIVVPFRPSFCLDRNSTQSLVRFGRWIFITGLIVVVGRSILQTVISRRLGTAELGLYFLATRLAFFPVQIASEVVGAVAFPLYAQMQSSMQQAARAFRLALLGLFTLLCPILSLLIVLAPSLASDVLGARWVGTGPIIQILALVSMIGLFGEAAAPIFKGFGQPYKVALLEAVQSLFIIICVTTLADHFGLVGAAFAWIPAIVLSQVICLLFIRQLFSTPLQGLSGPIGAIASVSLIGAGIAAVIDYVIPGLTGFILANLVAIAFVGLLLWIVDGPFAIGLSSNFVRIFPKFAGVFGLQTAER